MTWPSAYPGRVVGARIVLESERVGRPPRRGLIEAMVHGAPPAYRVLWDNGRTSLVTPSSGCASIDDEKVEVDSRSVSRSINDRIRELDQPWGGTYTFLCECEDAGCTSVMHLTEREFDDLRALEGHFATIPGHETSGGTGRVVARIDRYVVSAERADR
jgi:hypothetical protein